MTRLDPPPWVDDAAAQAVIAALEAEGGPGSARFVGGCVRDAVAGAARNPDLDIATPLTPDRVQAALVRAGLKAVPTGVEYGTVTGIADRRPFEITTLRRDVETDGRRAVVAFTTDWAEDAARRDFRLNALYAEPDGALHDPTGEGVADALAGRIVFVGDAETRIREDYLRILRFFRFRAWYGRGEPDAVGLAACAALKGGMAQLSAERLGKEMLKLLAAPDPRASVEAMEAAGVLAEIMPGATETARFNAMVAVSEDPVLRLSALLSDDAGAVEATAARLRLTNAQHDRLLAALPDEPAVTATMTPQAARAAAYRTGPQAVTDRLLRAQVGRGGDPAALLALLATWERPTLPVRGADLEGIGLRPGPAMGEALRRLEAAWIASDFTLTREALLAMA